jgi:hypothetical protein
MTVQIASGGAAGIQYTEGDTDASITGTAVMWEDGSDTLRVASVAKPMPIQISDGTRVSSIRDTGSTDSLNVAITDASGNQITNYSSSSGAFTDRSGTITAGGTQQTLAAALATRKYFFFQNLSIEDMWLNFTTVATADQPSIKVVSGGSFALEGSFVSTELISIIAATTGSKWTAKEA